MPRLKRRAVDIDPATITRIDRLDYGCMVRGDGVAQRFALGTAPGGTPVVILEDCWDNDRGLYLAELAGHTEEDLEVTQVWAYGSEAEARRDRDWLACEDLDDEELQLLSYERY
ncbi:hypothetical protein [Actinomadura sp. 3N407]|uniref:hypothetical protein n=1 Tax=Actinomadura sp. 3N407 TaxID=3457423 RepID=UPI003FCE0F83